MMANSAKIGGRGILGGVALSAGLLAFAPLSAQEPPAPVEDSLTIPTGPHETAAKPLPQPDKPGEKQGFIRRQVGRDVNPDASGASPLPQPESPATRQGFIRRQVGRDVNPDQQPQPGLAPPTRPDPVAQPTPGGALPAPQR